MLFAFVKSFTEEEHANNFISGRLRIRRLSYFKGLESDVGVSRVDPYEGAIYIGQPENIQIEINAMKITSD